MHNITVIGCGNIGKRHVEGLLSVAEKNWNIYLLDKTIDAAKQLQNSLGENKLIVAESIEDLPTDISVAIIATDSASRFELLSLLLKCKKVKNIILEKVVFTENNHFEIASKLLKDNGCKAYINYPRRLSKGYRTVSEKFIDNQIKQITIRGTNWGLLCNSLHFLDLIQTVTAKKINCTEIQIDQYLPAKREGYYEAFGKISGFSEDGKISFILESLPLDEKNKSQLDITFTGGISCEIDEIRKEILFHEYNQSSKFSLDLAYQSQLSGPIVQKIVNEDECLLPTLDEAEHAHCSFNSIIHRDMVTKNLISHQTEIPIT